MNGRPNGRVKPPGLTRPLDTKLVQDDKTDSWRRLVET
jgi:hypothetical protein